VNSAGVVAAAFAFGVAVGLLNNTISNSANRFAASNTVTGFAVSWPSVFALQFVLRLVLSVISLYITFRVSQAASGPILANLAGLLLTRYYLLWRLSRKGAGGVA